MELKNNLNNLNYNTLTLIIMKIDEIDYKGFTIEINYNNENTRKKNFSGKVDGIAFAYGYNTPLEAEEVCKKKIDEFLNDSPKNISELASKIQNSLVWSGYEECEVDEKILETIINQYIKATKQ